MHTLAAPSTMSLLRPTTLLIVLPIKLLLLLPQLVTCWNFLGPCFQDITLLSQATIAMLAKSFDNAASTCIFTVSASQVEVLTTALLP